MSYETMNIRAKCEMCNGTGTILQKVILPTGPIMVACPKCHGDTYYLSHFLDMEDYGSIKNNITELLNKSDDVLDKCNDILDKCNDILEQIGS